MAALDLEDALWVVKNRETGHDVLSALNEPPTGGPRVEKTYSRSTPLRKYKLNAPGCSEIHTLGYVRGSLLDQDA